MVDPGCETRSRLVLASSSPRRRELLAEAGYVFEVMPADVDESQPVAQGQKPAAWAAHLALLKAQVVARRIERGIVLGADTIVVADGEIYGKPVDAADARRTLATLLQTPHEVITGIALVDSESGRHETCHDATRIVMSPMSPEQLDDYIAGGLWRGKAGAYGIQDHDDAFVRELSGSFTNVVGLPLELLGAKFAEWGIRPQASGSGD